jgi:hypothetical protein
MVNPVVMDVVLDSLPTKVHEGLRLHEHTPTKWRNFGIPLRLKTEADCSAAGQFINNQESRVVARAGVFRTWVSQADNEAKDRCMLHAWGPATLLSGLRCRFGCLWFLLFDNFRSSRFLSRRGRLFCNGGLRNQKYREVLVGFGGDSRRQFDVPHMQ